MEFKKIIIDGKEYYEAIEDNDTSATEAKCEKSFKEDARIATEKLCDGARAFGVKVADTAKDIGVKTADVAKEVGKKTAVVAKEVGKKTADVAKEVGKKTAKVGSKVMDGAKNAGEKIAVDMKIAGLKIKEGAERLFSKDRSLDPTSKEAKLIKLLPYMSRKETHDTAMQFLESDNALFGIDLSAILPFLSGEDCNAIFLKSIEIGKRNIDISTAMQFVDSATLKAVVDGYLEGKYPKLNIDEFYPFLEDKDIKRIFDHIVGKGE